MENRTSKAALALYSVIFLVLIVVLNVVSFAIPFPHKSEDVFLTEYILAEVVIVLEGVLLLVQTGGQSAKNKVMGLPMVWAGFLGMIAQVIVTAVFYIVNAFVAVPLWIVWVLEVILLGYFIVQVTMGYFFKARSEEYHEHLENTAFMDGLRARLKALQTMNKVASVSRSLEDLYDIARGSDSVTNDSSKASEDELGKKLDELEKAVGQGNEAEINKDIDAMKNLLAKRNALAKAGK